MTGLSLLWWFGPLSSVSYDSRRESRSGRIFSPKREEGVVSIGASRFGVVSKETDACGDGAGCAEGWVVNPR